MNSLVSLLITFFLQRHLSSREGNNIIETTHTHTQTMNNSSNWCRLACRNPSQIRSSSSSELFSTVYCNTAPVNDGTVSIITSLPGIMSSVGSGKHNFPMLFPGSLIGNANFPYGNPVSSSPGRLGRVTWLLSGEARSFWWGGAWK